MISCSVVIPAWNAERTIAEAIRSVQAQTLPPAEIVVVNDGSTDGTVAVVEELAATASPALPVRLLHQANAGPGSATSHGVARASQPLVATLDADDLWLSHKLERQMARLSADPQLVLVAARMQAFPHDQPPDPSAPVRSGLVRSTLVFQRQLLEVIGPFHDPPGGVGDVVDWLGRLRQQGLAMAELSEVLALRRILPGSLSHRSRQAMAGAFLAVAHQALRRRNGDATGSP